MSQKLKVCVLTPRFPYPVIGGDRLRIYEICRELSKTCELTLLSLCESKDELYQEIPNDGVFQRVERVLLSKSQSFWNVFKSLHTKKPLQVAYYESGKFRELVNAQLSDHDVFVAHLIRVGQYLIEKDVPRVLEMTDAISLNYSRFLADKSLSYFDLRSWVYKLEAKRVKDYEMACIKDFDAVSLVSDVDQQFLCQDCDCENVIVCSNGVQLEKFPSYGALSDSKRIAFVGNMYSVQNLDAVFYFARRVLPILREVDDFVFKVIGRIHDRDAVRLRELPGVIVRPNVKSVSEELTDVFAAVAPIRLGAGVQNKVLEYMAAAIPTVVSELAAEGLGAVDGKHFLIARDEGEFAELLLSVSRDDSLAERLASAGRDYVEESHTWSSQLADFVSMVENLRGQN
ncbi:glycosyltransferase family 4 protein [uncultured Marinobacter sp.]|uniref:glycosyltransferase family 4 protein n=1 Tax=uncultured Marinobacter sp. TaxID=187379 RepID=UPI0030C885F0